MTPLSTLRGKENRLPAMLRAQGKASGGSVQYKIPGDKPSAIVKISGYN